MVRSIDEARQLGSTSAHQTRKTESKSSDSTGLVR